MPGSINRSYIDLGIGPGSKDSPSLTVPIIQLAVGGAGMAGNILLLLMMSWKLLKDSSYAAYISAVSSADLLVLFISCVEACMRIAQAQLNEAYASYLVACGITAITYYLKYVTFSMVSYTHCLFFSILFSIYSTQLIQAFAL